MSVNYKIWTALVIAMFCVLAAVWQIVNVRGIRARGRRRSGSAEDKARSHARISDQPALTKQDKKLYAEAKKLLQMGKVLPAARILEQLKMPREAIQTLEDHGFIHDAAKILMRMQRNNRAGVVYARHGMWEHAAQCFKMANMPLEVAKCSRELGQMDVAAEYYELASRWVEAAECFEQAGLFQRAAKLFGQAEQPHRQMSMYQRMAATGPTATSGDFTDPEIQQISEYLATGHIDQNLAAAVGRRGRLADVILRLVHGGKNREAAEILQVSAVDMAPQLIALVNYQDVTAPGLAELFTSVSDFGHAGVIYERLSAFDRAALSFEKAADFTRAAYCYERAGRSAEAQMMRNKSKTPENRPLKIGAGQPNFALGNINAEDGLAAGVSEDATQVLRATPVQPSQAPTSAPLPRSTPAAFDKLSATKIASAPSEVDMDRAAPVVQVTQPQSAIPSPVAPAPAPVMPSTPVAPAQAPAAQFGFAVPTPHAPPAQAPTIQIPTAQIPTTQIPTTQPGFTPPPNTIVPSTSGTQSGLMAAPHTGSHPAAVTQSGQIPAQHPITQPTQVPAQAATPVLPGPAPQSPPPQAVQPTPGVVYVPTPTPAPAPIATPTVAPVSAPVAQVPMPSPESAAVVAPIVPIAPGVPVVPGVAVTPPAAAAGSPLLFMPQTPTSATNTGAGTSPGSSGSLNTGAALDSGSSVTPLRSEVGLSALDKVTFCADLDSSQRSKLWAAGVGLAFRADDTILSYDGEPRGLYIIIRGSVSCYRRTAGKEVYIDQMGEFESFGELWLLADQPTAVRFVATKPTEIRLIERPAFIELLDKDGSIARKLYRRFTMRLLSRLLKTNNSSKTGMVS